MPGFAKRRSAGRVAAMSAVALSLSVASISADEATPSGPPPAPEQISAIAVADWNGDQRDDVAMLLGREDSADLVIYLTQENDPFGPQMAVRAPKLVWRGALWGTQPSLNIAADGALEVVSTNSAIGRNRWTITLTVVLREEQFILTHYRYRAIDTLEPGAEVQCDVNLRSGLGTLNGAPFSIEAAPLPIDSWSADHVIPECGF